MLIALLLLKNYNDIQKFIHWSDIDILHLNISMCKIIVFTKLHNKFDQTKLKTVYNTVVNQIGTGVSVLLVRLT